MLESNNPTKKHKAGLLNLVEGLGNVSQACKVMGLSRDCSGQLQPDTFLKEFSYSTGD